MSDLNNLCRDGVVNLYLHSLNREGSSFRGSSSKSDLVYRETGSRHSPACFTEVRLAIVVYADISESINCILSHAEFLPGSSPVCSPRSAVWWRAQCWVRRLKAWNSLLVWKSNHEDLKSFFRKLCYCNMMLLLKSSLGLLQHSFV